MKVIETGIPGLFEIIPDVHYDLRGSFCELYHEDRYHDAGIANVFLQENYSESSYGVIRGLHFQRPPFSQAKLAMCALGKIWDVAVDLRVGSPTFGKWHGVLLDSEKHNQFLIPRGFAHGFSVLSERACFSYRCDNYYHPEAEGGIAYNDPILSIDWKVPEYSRVISEKDRLWPCLNVFNSPFVFQDLNSKE